ncbi:fungal hydrophobin-domain-containing protein [Trametes meyenii]|nr:fungal hydrophobin-domain-containing protein [Trametes meyenii]
MRSTIVLAILALIVATVQAVSIGTNAERMARGLPPRAPAKLFNPTPVTAAKRNKPSHVPPPSSPCSTGPVQCCDKLTNSKDPLAKLLIQLLGIVVKPDVGVGLTCSPLSIIGLGGEFCKANTVCCENNSLGGLISIGCIPSTCRAVWTQHGHAETNYFS